MKQNKTIVVNASALRSGGALTILRQFVEAIPDDSFKYLLFVDESVTFQKIPANLQAVPLNKRSFLKRFLWDAYGLQKWLKRHRIKPSVALSLQNTNFRTGYRIPNYVYYHQPLPFFSSKWNPLKKTEHNLWFYKNIYPFFVKLFLNSQTEIFVQLEYIKNGFSSRFSFAREKIHVVFPDVSLPQPKTNCNSCAVAPDKGKFNLFYPATYLFYKNHKILFKAFSLIDKKLSIRIVLYLSIKNDFNSTYSFENIEIVSAGQIPHEDMYEWYSKMDALVFPSYIETLGLPLIEAASLGLPVIVSDLPYSREVLNGYEGSKYVSHTDAEDWGKALLKLASIPKIRYSPFRRENKNSWNSLFQIIKRKI